MGFISLQASFHKFALASVVWILDFAEKHIAFKVPQSQGLLQVLGILERWSNIVF